MLKIREAEKIGWKPIRTQFDVARCTFHLLIVTC